VLVASSSLPSELTIFAIEQKIPVSIEDIMFAEKELRNALSYETDTAAVNSQLSFLGLHRLTTQTRSADTYLELVALRDQVEAALKHRPLDAYLWTRYAHVSYLLDGLSPYTLAALKRSFQYGSDEYELFKFRMLLCIKEWNSLPPSLQQLTRKQISYGASQKRLWRQILAEMDTETGGRLILLLAEAQIDPREIEELTNRLN